MGQGLQGVLPQIFILHPWQLSFMEKFTQTTGTLPDSRILDSLILCRNPVKKSPDCLSGLNR